MNIIEFIEYDNDESEYKTDLKKLIDSRMMLRYNMTYLLCVENILDNINHKYSDYSNTFPNDSNTLEKETVIEETISDLKDVNDFTEYSHCNINYFGRDHYTNAYHNHEDINKIYQEQLNKIKSDYSDKNYINDIAELLNNGYINNKKYNDCIYKNNSMYKNILINIDYNIKNKRLYI